MRPERGQVLGGQDFMDVGGIQSKELVWKVVFLVYKEVYWM